MKKIFLSIAVIALSICSLSAQTLDEIVVNHLKAIGGEAKLKEVKSVEMENTIKIQGLEMANLTSIVVNSAVRSESKVMENTLVQAFDGSTAWENTPVMMGGSGKPQLMADEMAGTVINQADPFPLLDYVKKETKLELLDSKNGNFHLRMSPKIGAESELWLSAKTGLVSKLKTFQNGQDIEILFSNYTEIEGINFALHMEVMGGMVTIDTKSVKLNNIIDASIFKMPTTK
jgi:hypothetical protein